jgi:hypothetical protein
LLRHRVVDRVGHEQLAGERPQRIDRRLHAHVRHVGAVAEPDHPVGRALDVVGDLLRGLRGDRGDALVARSGERREREGVPVVVQELARGRVGVVAVRLLAQERVAELVHVAAVRQRVLVAARALDLARVGQPHPRLPEQVEADVARARCPPRGSGPCRPIRQALREHEVAVAEAQQELEACGRPCLDVLHVVGIGKNVGCR